MVDQISPLCSGAGVPQQLQAIQVHPNAQTASNSDSSPEMSHSSTNSTGTSPPISLQNIIQQTKAM